LIYEAPKTAYAEKVMITDDQICITHKLMSDISEESIDYAVIEKFSNLKVTYK